MRSKLLLQITLKKHHYSIINWNRWLTADLLFHHVDKYDMFEQMKMDMMQELDSLQAVVEALSR